MQQKRPDQTAQSTLIEGDLSALVLKAFYKTYNVLGFGFLESIYRRAMLIELRKAGVVATSEVPMDVFYEDEEVGHFKLDILVEGRLAVELKATAVLGPTDKRQLINYLKAGRLDVGLLLHYGPDPVFHRLLNPKYGVQ